MIPDNEDQCPASRTSSNPVSSVTIGPFIQEKYHHHGEHSSPPIQSLNSQHKQREQLKQREQNQQYEQLQQDETAWSKYQRFTESMKSRGQIFDRKLLLEAMFRGSDLVYSAS
ncbi:hypothetical protein QAD02_022369 [Eretmocerus hayati]|uniref:Uncharacterized protein n=1 Tax=Eretmocerus hayati TaxID=131215 RepID=A0ACC2PSJ9_9HYME|nr:hypothetical protein QAD02_022369 [Eretmocerus hayati]